MKARWEKDISVGNPSQASRAQRLQHARVSEEFLHSTYTENERCLFQAAVLAAVMVDAHCKTYLLLIKAKDSTPEKKKSFLDQISVKKSLRKL